MATMTSRLRVIGIDPGPTPGLVRLDYDDGRLWEVDVVQCTASFLWSALDALANRASDDRRVLVCAEKFVVRGRLNGAQSLTRDQVAAIEQLQRVHGRPLVLNPASRVKAWATNGRLDAVRQTGEAHSLFEICKGMTHARDAARHAIFTASHDGRIPDPLSKHHTTSTPQGTRP